MSETSVLGADAFTVVHHPAKGSADVASARAAKRSKPTGTAAAVKKKYTISVNGEEHTFEVAGDTPLLYILRDYLDLRGPKFGCGLVQCGACAVLLNGRQIRSCVYPIDKVGKDAVVTLEGLAATYHGTNKAKLGRLHPLQQAWIDKQVPQCGYCQSGMIIQAADLLSKSPNPTLAEIKSQMNGHLCRCGTYFRIIEGIQEAARVMRAGTKS
jgi:isoquinoline 1-oxidoreductase subunit alpha